MFPFIFQCISLQVLHFKPAQRASSNEYLSRVFTWTVVLHVGRPVLCIIWTCMQPWVTTTVPVLKTARSPYSNRRCCPIRVYHPYLTAWSPPLIILWHGLRAAGGHALPTLHGHVTGADRTLMDHLLPYGTHSSLPFWSTWFIIHLSFHQAGRSQVQFLVWLFMFDHIFVLKTLNYSRLQFFSAHCTISTPPTIENRSLTCTQTNINDAKLTSRFLLWPIMLSCITLTLFGMHPPKTILHLWALQRPASRWSDMAASSSLDSLLRAKIGCYQANIRLLFSHTKNRSIL